MSVRIDMHVHTSASDDAFIQMRHIKAVFCRGKIDMIIILDHNTIEGALEAKKIWNDRIIVGEEIDTGEGEVAGIFLKESIPPYMGITDTVNALKEQKAVIYLPHPFDKGRPILRADALQNHSLSFDIVECYNSKVKRTYYNFLAYNFAKSINASCGAGSDAHLPCEIGAAYVVLPRFPDGKDAFTVMLKSATIRGRHQRFTERLIRWGRQKIKTLKKYFY